MVYVERACSVNLRYLDERGGARQLNASGPLSELLQHEMDHLDGILAVDRAIDRDSLCTRDEWERRWRGLSSGAQQAGYAGAGTPAPSRRK
jgi:peptide deformylase